jgi:hypothetical protein
MDELYTEYICVSAPFVPNPEEEKKGRFRFNVIVVCNRNCYALTNKTFIFTVSGSDLHTLPEIPEE